MVVRGAHSSMYMYEFVQYVATCMSCMCTTYMYLFYVIQYVCNVVQYYCKGPFEKEQNDRLSGKTAQGHKSEVLFI